MNMQKKYFRCYFCETWNSYPVPKEEKGKNCRCCLAYNYFFKKSHKRYRNNNNAYYKKYHYKKNTFHNTKNSFHKSNNRYNSTQDNQTNLPFSLIQTQNTNLTLQNLFNYNYLNINIPKKNKEEEIKYKWLKKEKMTKKYIDKNKEGYECTICLEKIKLNEDINILKCSHIFHYKCIEELINHNNNKCPNCRADLKTGENQKIKINNIYNDNGIIYHNFGTPDFFDEINYFDFNYENDTNRYEEEDIYSEWISSLDINDESY